MTDLNRRAKSAAEFVVALVLFAIFAPLAIHFLLGVLGL